jgi:hypothetical protein
LLPVGAFFFETRSAAESQANGVLFFTNQYFTLVAIFLKAHLNHARTIPICLRAGSVYDKGSVPFVISTREENTANLRSPKPVLHEKNDCLIGDSSKDGI